MGPVIHNMPNLPQAKNLENFHQFSKVFQSEVDENGDPTPAFREMRIRAFGDPVPHRHKFDYPEIKKMTQGNINKPLYSVFSDSNGTERRFSYVQSRYFYCSVYTQFCLRDNNFENLKEMIRDGINLQIVGYDAYDVGDKDLYDCYLDDSRPFGHELVLYTLLTVHDKTQYPWEKYREINSKIYF
jgi:hypothetical protein